MIVVLVLAGLIGVGFLSFATDVFDVAGPACDDPNDSNCTDDHVINEQTLLDRYELLEEYRDGSATGIRALCNDLSDPPLYFKPAEDGSETKYVVYLPGGSGCWDEETCDSRWDVRPEDMIRAENDTLRGRGITNSDQFVGLNPFKDWNMVWLQYCTSDGYIGRMDIDDPNNPTRNSASAAEVGQVAWHFAGDTVTQALWATLLANHGLDQATDIIITASSAGAEGLFQQMTRVGDMLAEEAPLAKVKFGFDNGWHVSDVDDDWDGNDNPGEEAENREGMYNGWNPNLNDECVESFLNNPEDTWTCLYTADILYPFQKYKDFHMHMHEFDFMQFSGYGIGFGNWLDWSDEELEFCLYLAGVLVDAAIATDETVTSFSMPACREHDDWDKGSFTYELMESVQDSGDYDYILSDYIWNFYQDDEIFRTWDTCMYPYCNPTCAILPYDTTEGCTFC